MELPELNQLRGKHKQTEWLEEVQELLSDPLNTSFEQLKEAMDIGTDLPQHPAVEKALGEISGLLTQVNFGVFFSSFAFGRRFKKRKDFKEGEAFSCFQTIFNFVFVLALQGDAWEDKVKQCLSAKPRWSMSEVEKLVEEGEEISSGLPSLNLMRDHLRKAKEWWSRAEAIQRPEVFPFLETMEALVAKGRPLPVRLEPLSNLETLVSQIYTKALTRIAMSALSMPR